VRPVCEATRRTGEGPQSSGVVVKFYLGAPSSPSCPSLSFLPSPFLPYPIFLLFPSFPFSSFRSRDLKVQLRSLGERRPKTHFCTFPCSKTYLVAVMLPFCYAAQILFNFFLSPGRKIIQSFNNVHPYHTFYLYRVMQLSHDKAILKQFNYHC